MVCVCNFRDLCPRLSPREVSVKVSVMKFGFNFAGEISLKINGYLTTMVNALLNLVNKRIAKTKIAVFKPTAKA